MKKYFVCSDIHSFYDEWMAALNRAGFDKNNSSHSIIVCGDLLDRGPQPLECLKFVNDMYDKGRAILIRGNHEDLLESVFSRKYFELHDVSNGTVETCEILSGALTDWSRDISATVIKKAQNNRHLRNYLKHLVDYAEIGNNIFVHGWIPMKYATDDLFDNTMVYNPDWREASLPEWEDARWLNGMLHWHNGCKEEGKTIWCGHYHASYGNSRFHNDGLERMKRFETFTVQEGETRKLYVNHHTFRDDGIVALDASTVISGFVNCEVIEEE